LLSANLLILAVVIVLLTLHLIADQSAGTEAEAATDGRACSRMTDRRTNKTTRSSATKRANTGAFFSGC